MIQTIIDRLNVWQMEVRYKMSFACILSINILTLSSQNFKCCTSYARNICDILLFNYVPHKLAKLVS